MATSLLAFRRVFYQILQSHSSRHSNGTDGYPINSIGRRSIPSRAGLGLLADLEFAELRGVDFVGSVGKTDEALGCHDRCKRHIIADAHAAKYLDGTVRDRLCHLRRDHLDCVDQTPCPISYGRRTAKLRYGEPYL